jgi:hypothetical protein
MTFLPTQSLATAGPPSASTATISKSGPDSAANPSVSLLDQLNPPSVVDPSLFLAIEILCRSAITYGGNHPTVRSDVNRVVSNLRRLATARHGHDSIEVVSLLRLLERTHPLKEQHQRPPAEPDPIEELEFRRRLSPEQSAAASLMRNVWDAFQRGLAISPRSMEKLGSHKRARPVHPIDVMGRRVYEVWRDHYIPWYEKAKLRRVERRTSGNVGAVDIVWHILIEGQQPVMVDRCFRLDGGVAEKTLKFELDQFWGNKGPGREAI